MTAADISTHSEGKRADILSWVTKLGSNYIALSRQPRLPLTRPDIWSVSAGYQFCSLPPPQQWAAMYFGYTYGLLDIVLLAGRFLWLDQSLVYTSALVMVGVPERQHTAASLNKQLFRSQHTSQDDGQRANVAPHGTSLRFLGLCCSWRQGCNKSIFIFFYPGVLGWDFSYVFLV